LGDQVGRPAELGRAVGEFRRAGGEALAGVIYAGIVVAFGGKTDPLAIMPEGFAGVAPWVGVVLFVGTLWYLYRGARQESTRD